MPYKSRQRRKGVAAAEMAVLLPLLITLFVIALDWSRIIYYAVTVSNCARNGAIWLVDPYSGTMSPYASLTDAAVADAPNLSPLPTVARVPDTGYSTDANGNKYVECKVSYDFKMITSFPGVPKTTTVTRTVRVYPLPLDPK
jgi:Flp pilus assembly protein TadG